MQTDLEKNEIILLIEEIASTSPYKIVLSQPGGEFRKAEIQTKLISGKRIYQIEKFTEKQAFHENIEEAELLSKLEKLFGKEFYQLNSFSTSFDYSLKLTKKGKLLKNRTKAKNTGIQVTGNNRKKNYILEEGMVIPTLVDMGVFTKEGKVVNSMYDKFKQINRFIELVDDVIKNEKHLNIIDFGCGKSYLTFILYYYLVEVKKLDVSITGLDLKADVIRKCNEVAKKYGYTKIKFALGDINGYKTDQKVDMVITLHACDTATDYALYNAISWNAKYILSVPCCQHEVNKDIQTDVLKPLMKYGVIKQRTSELVTDSLRASLLEYCGYKTQLLEFIDIAHSPKNLLIRAVKSDISKEKREEALMDVKKMCSFFDITPTLLSLIMNK